MKVITVLAKGTKFLRLVMFLLPVFAALLLPTKVYSATVCPEYVPIPTKYAPGVTLYNAIARPNLFTDSLEELAYAIADDSIAYFTQFGYICEKKDLLSINGGRLVGAPITAPFACLVPTNGVWFSGSFYYQQGIIRGCPTGYDPTLVSFLGPVCKRTDPDLQICPQSPDLTAPQKDLGCRNPRGNPCNAGTGNKYHVDVDYRTQDGLLVFSRHFNNLLKSNLGFGSGWTTETHKKLALSTLTSAVLVRESNGRSELFAKDGSNAWRGDSDTSLALTEDATGYTFTHRNGTSERYDRNGRIVWSKDNIGRTTTYSYDTNGRLTTVTDPYGRKLLFTYDAGGRLLTWSTLRGLPLPPTTMTPSTAT